MSSTTFAKDEQNLTLTIERVFDASRDRVWRAVTDSDILDQWWAPGVWQTKTVEMNFRVGGRWLYSMNGPDGERHFGRMDFIEIEPGLRFVASDVFADAEGNANESLPAQLFETLLHEEGKRTRLVIVVTYSSLADLEKVLEMGMQEGLSMAHDQLAALLARGGV